MILVTNHVARPGKEISPRLSLIRPSDRAGDGTLVTVTCGLEEITKCKVFFVDLSSYAYNSTSLNKYLSISLSIHYSLFHTDLEKGHSVKCLGVNDENLTREDHMLRIR